MRLVELEARFVRIIDERSYQEQDELTGADGILFLCPKCFQQNSNSAIGVHSVLCWAPQVPQTIQPTPGRWTMQGRGIDDLTLVAALSSVLLTGEGCQAHFYVRNGEIINC